MSFAIVICFSLFQCHPPNRLPSWSHHLRHLYYHNLEKWPKRDGHVEKQHRKNRSLPADSPCKNDDKHRFTSFRQCNQGTFTKWNCDVLQGVDFRHAAWLDNCKVSDPLIGTGPTWGLWSRLHSWFLELSSYQCSSTWCIYLQLQIVTACYPHIFAVIL